MLFRSKNALHLHFLMEDNPSLSPVKVKYNSNQGIPCIRKWICANHIARLLESDLKLTDE